MFRIVLSLFALLIALPAHTQSDPMEALRRGLKSAPQQAPTGGQDLGVPGTASPATGQVAPGQSFGALSSNARFDPAPYARGRRLLHLYNGDFDELAKEDQHFVTVYFLKMNEYFSSAINYHAPNCSAYFDPGLAPGVVRDAMDSMMDSRGNVSKQGLDVLGQMFQQLSQGPAGLINRASYIEEEQNAAQKDGVLLSQLPGGCENPQFKRLYNNMKNYVRGDEPAEANGWPGLRLACVDHAATKGGHKPEARKHCRCMAQQFQDAKVPVDEIERLRLSYDHGPQFSSVVGKYEGLRKKLGACLL